MFEEWKTIPKEAKNLIIYYSIGCVEISLEFFFAVYLYALGFSLKFVGVLYFIFYGVTAIVSIILGYLIDVSISPKYLIMIIDGASIIVWIIIAFATREWHFVIALIIEAIVTPFFIAYRAIERDLYPQDKLEIVYKYHMMIPYLTQALTLMVYGIFLSKDFIIRFRILSLVSAGLAAILVTWTLLKLPPTTKVRTKKKFEWFIFNKKLVLLGSAEIIIISAFYIAPFWILDYFIFKILGMSPLIIGLLYAIGAMLGAIGAIIHGELKGTGSISRLTIGLFLLASAFVMMYSLGKISYVLIIAFIAMTLLYFGNSIWWIEHESIIMREIPEDKRGTFFGVMRTVRTLITVPAPMVAIYLAKKGVLFPFLVGSLMVISGLYFYIIAMKLGSQKN